MILMIPEIPESAAALSYILASTSDSWQMQRCKDASDPLRVTAHLGKVPAPGLASSPAYPAIETPPGGAMLFLKSVYCRISDCATTFHDFAFDICALVSAPCYSRSASFISAGYYLSCLLGGTDYPNEGE